MPEVATWLHSRDNARQQQPAVSTIVLCWVRREILRLLGRALPSIGTRLLAVIAQGGKTPMRGVSQRLRRAVIAAGLQNKTVHGDVGAQEIHLTPRFQTSPKVQALVTALQRGLQMLHKQQAATSLPAILTPTAAMC